MFLVHSLYMQYWYYMCTVLSSSQLRYQFGDSTVRVHVSQSGRFDGPENGQLWGLSADAEVLVRYAYLFSSTVKSDALIF